MLRSEDARHPYPGLRPFETHEADLFFGREEHVDALLKRLSNAHFVAVVGESGAGKSSLVRAGLLPALEAGFVVEAGSDWRVAVMRPGGAPLAALADALLAPGVLSPAGDTPKCEFALAELRRGPLGLVQLVRDARLGESCNTLIVVDQFEELFRYCREPAQKDQATVFVELLLNASRQRQVPIFVVLTMRSDFVGDCARFRGLPEVLNDNQYLTPRLTRDQIALAIREPARVCGGVVENALVDELCNAVGDDQDQLPLLQHLLMRLWDRAGTESSPRRLTSEISRVMGGLRLALNNHAQQIYDSLSEDQQAVTCTLFKSLTDPRSLRRDLRRDALVSEIAAIAAVPAAAVIAVADEFRAQERHMLMPPPSVPLESDSRLDISHESLLRQWSTLGEWALQEGVNAREFDRFREEAQLERDEKGELLTGKDLARALEWISQAQPTPAWAERYAPSGELDATLDFIRRSEAQAERQKRNALLAVRREASARRTKVFLFIGIVFAVLLGVVAIGAVTLWRDAEAGRAQAHVSQLAANALLVLENDPSLALLLARRAVAERDTDERAIGALRDAIAAHVPSVASPFPVAKSRNYLEDTGKTAWLDFSLSAASVSGKEALAIVPSGKNAVIWSTISGEPIHTLTGHGDIVGAAGLSPDGALAVTAGADRTARVWNAATGNPVTIPLQHDDLVNKAVFNRDGSLLVTLGDDAAQIWNVGRYDSARCRLTVEDRDFHAPRQFVEASFSQDQTLLVTVTQITPAVSRRSNWQAEVWNVARDGCPRVDVPLLAKTKDLQWASFSDHGPWLGIVNVLGEVAVLNVQDWREKRKSDRGDPYPTNNEDAPAENFPPPLAWSSDGQQFAYASGDNVVWVAEIQTKGVIALRGHTGRISRISFDPKDRFLLTTSADRTARVWHLGKKHAVQPFVLKGHKESVGSGVFSRTGAEIITAGDDGTVRSWKPPLSENEPPLLGLRSMARSADGKQIWLSGVDATDPSRGFWISALAADTLKAVREVVRVPMDNSNLYFIGSAVIQRLSSDELTVRDVREPSKELPIRDLRREDLSYAPTTSPDGRFIVSWTDTDTVKVWDLRKPQAPAESRSAGEPRCSVTGISDDKRLAWYCAEKDIVRVDSAQRGQPAVSIGVQTQNRVASVRFSTSGRWLAVALEYHTIEVFDTETGKSRSVMRGHDGVIVALDFSDDDRFLVSASTDGTVRVWDITSGAKIAELAISRVAPPSDVAFSPDGLSVLLLAPDTLRTWRCHACGDVPALLEEVRRRNIEHRDLLPAEEARLGLTTEELNADRGARSSHVQDPQRR